MEKGLLRYAVIDKPLPIHKMAAKAGEASHCANDQDKFWEMHKLMMSQQDAIENLAFYAVSLNLDFAQFDKCLKTNKYKKQIDEEAAFSRKIGIAGVPGFVIAATDPENPTKAKGISFIRGALPFAIFENEIDKALKDLSQQKVPR